MINTEIHVDSDIRYVDLVTLIFDLLTSTLNIASLFVRQFSCLSL